MTCIAYHRERGGGSVRLAYDLAQGLLARGHQLSVVAEDVFEDGEGIRVEDGVTVLRYRLPSARRIPFRRHSQHIAATAKALRLLPSKPDAVHGHSLFQYVAAVRAFAGRARLCFSVHSPAVDELRITWKAQGWVGALKSVGGLSTIRRLERECLKASDNVTAESGYTRILLARAHGDAEARRVATVPGWVDLERFRPIPEEDIPDARRRLGWPVDRPVLFVLRRLEARMGLDNLLRALAIVHQRGHDCRTYIGGSGSQLAALIKLRDELGLTREVDFMGFVPGEVLPLAYAASDASVIPTAQLECFGIIALEALACGRPTLVTPVGALTEVVGSFEPAWIAESNTPDDIASLIIAYLQKRLPSHSSIQLRSTIEEKYGFAAALTQFESFLVQ